ncbi:MAG: type II toxin-antitoxin system HicA family toxin [Acaryochloridaceae cyanobacterium RU_4_10]|nr:type II toxin-antitoxin system HicA family toxin [Acaryochloridaceae cyanobacterium RU_4_10]
MMPKKVTFAELEQLLLGLGFVSRPPKGTHHVFGYPALDVLVSLPDYHKKDLVHPAHLVMVRRVLAENGLMNSDEFDALSSFSEVCA